MSCNRITDLAVSFDRKIEKSFVFHKFHGIIDARILCDGNAVFGHDVARRKPVQILLCF